MCTLLMAIIELCIISVQSEVNTGMYKISILQKLTTQTLISQQGVGGLYTTTVFNWLFNITARKHLRNSGWLQFISDEKTLERFTSGNHKPCSATALSCPLNKTRVPLAAVVPFWLAETLSKCCFSPKDAEVF